jgi:hypothetical protein
MRGLSRLAEELFASKEGLCCLEAVVLYLPWYLRVQGKALVSVTSQYLGVPSSECSAVVA